MYIYKHIWNKVRVLLKIVVQIISKGSTQV